MTDVPERFNPADPEPAVGAEEFDPNAAERNPELDRLMGGGSGGGAPDDDEMITPDFSQATSFFMEPGEYEARVLTKPTKEPAREGKAPCVVFVFEIMTPGKYKGWTRQRWCPYEGTLSGFLQETLKAIGLDDEAAGKAPFRLKDAEGRWCMLTMKARKDDPERDVIQRTKPHAKGPFPEPAPTFEPAPDDVPDAGDEPF